METRFKGYRWNVMRVRDANDQEAFAEAVKTFRRTKNKPMLIIVDSIIGYGAPHKQDTAAAHSEPLGVEEARRVLALLRATGSHRFLVDDVSMTDADVPPLVGHRQVSGAHLLTVARRHGIRVITFDAGVARST